MDSAYQKRTDFISKVVPVGLDFLFAKTRAMVEYLKFLIKQLIQKTISSWTGATSNKTWSQNVMNRQESYLIFQLKDIHKIYLKFDTYEI